MQPKRRPAWLREPSLTTEYTMHSNIEVYSYMNVTI